MSWKIPIKRRVLLLRTCRRVDDRLLAHGDWEWPDQVGAIVTAPDWNPEAVCGGGLHGLLWGEGDPGHLEWGGSGAWMVVEADSREVVDLGDKVKVPRCIIRHIGDRVSAGAYLQAHGGAGRRIHGATATAGDAGTATAGDRGTATAGYAGTATAGAEGTATAGDRGTATAGDAGTATAGAEGTATAGDRGTATAGYAGTATAGYAGTATAGDAGTATAGYAGTATAGYAGTATAGYAGTATAGDDGLISVRWWDGRANRYRMLRGFIGQDGLLPNVAYRVEVVDGAPRWVRATPGGAA